MNKVLAILELIPSDWKVRFRLLFLLYVVLGVLEMLGVASILPFIALLADPQALDRSFVAGLFQSVASVPLGSVPVHWIGLVVLTLFLVTNLLALLSTWLSIRFSNRLAVRLASEVAARYFARGYGFLRARSPSLLANFTVREVEKVVSGGVLQLCLLLSRSIQVALIFVLLTVVSPLFSLAFSAVSLFLYLGFYHMLRDRLATAGQELIQSSGQAANAADALYSGAKEILVCGKLDFFLADVRRWLFRRGLADEMARVFPVIPKYAIELAAFSAILSIPIYQSWTGSEYRSMVPFMALFVYAGYRLLPALQQVFAAASTLKFIGPTINYFHEFLKHDAPAGERQGSVCSFRTLALENVGFGYPESERPALDDISLEIAEGEKIAVVGLSGAGKSTLIDLLLGLIAPMSGRIRIDGRECGPQGLKWADGCIGYAPQSPMMLDGTVAENIAFGIAADAIDETRCMQAARLACIDEVVKALPEGYRTRLGNEGAALSGGESQRIAVARALYHKPRLAVFDEPTSDLDPPGSRRLMANLCDHTLPATVIVVTHDWNALDLFDRIIVLSEGRMIACGNSQEVAKEIEFLKIRFPANTTTKGLP